MSAHGDDPAQENETAAEGTPADGDTAEWAARMEGHMTDHMGPDAVDEMEAHMGVTVDEMPRDMADEDHAAGMNGQGHGCYSSR